MGEQLQGGGWELVPFGRAADLGIINTCTVTREAEAKCRQAIRKFTRVNPTAVTVVAGCISQVAAERVAAIEGVDLVLGNDAKMQITRYLDLVPGKSKAAVVVRDRLSPGVFHMPVAPATAPPYPWRANLKIQDGCSFACSFCLIPFARGGSRSRDWENTLTEARNMARRGVREFVLTGINLGTYMHGDRGILDLVDALDAIPGIVRVRISSIEATTVPEPLFERMREPGHALMPLLHLPLQSGSNRILERMRRKYTVREYVQFAEKALESMPDLCLGTDIMVGFPGEMEEDFKASCDLLNSLPFAYSHVFPYSERAKTLAVKRYPEEMIPVEQRQERAHILRALAKHKKMAFIRRFAGQTRPVLFEDSRNGHWPGYTDNYIRVVCPKITRHPDGDLLVEHTTPARLHTDLWQSELEVNLANRLALVRLGSCEKPLESLAGQATRTSAHPAATGEIVSLLDNP